MCIRDSGRTIQAMKILAEKTGIYGMLGGQSVDVENEKNDIQALDKELLDYIYLNKTAALLAVSYTHLDVYKRQPHPPRHKTVIFICITH